jgi:hypothetical protein
MSLDRPTVVVVGGDTEDYSGEPTNQQREEWAQARWAYEMRLAHEAETKAFFDREIVTARAKAAQQRKERAEREPFSNELVGSSKETER